jgi:hypothetical protein
MEQLILTCLEAQLMIGRVLKKSLPVGVKIELIAEIQRVSPKICPIDAKAD